MRLPLYLRFALILTLALCTLGVGSLYTSWSIWKNLSQGYALSSLKSKFDQLSQGNIEHFPWETTEWAFEVVNNNELVNAHWLKSPNTYSPSELEILAGETLEKILDTKTNEGSFESGEHYILYQGNNEKLLVMGSLSHVNYRNLQPWAIPYLSLFWAIFLFAFFFAFLLTLYINKSYKKLRTAVETMSTGRYENVSLPTSSDPELSLLTESIKKMIMLLDSRDNELSKISQIASEDPLTKLPNYRALQKCVGEINKPKNESQKNWIAILDIDFFKKINDSYGHLCGDEALQNLASIFKKYTNEKQFFARYGGEEFVCVLKNITIEEAQNTLVQLGKEIKENKIKLSDECAATCGISELSITVSMGLNQYNETLDLKENMDSADKALYRAKKKGRCQLVQIQPEAKEWSF